MRRPSNVNWAEMRVEIPDPLEYGRVIIGWSRNLARQPAEYVVVRSVDQVLELVEFSIRHIGEMCIGELTDDHIHLAKSAMPRTEQNAAAALVEARTASSCPSHPLASSPGRRGPIP